MIIFQILYEASSTDDADMAELVDATDLKSVGTLLPCRFDPGFPHHKKAPERVLFFITYCFKILYCFLNRYDFDNIFFEIILFSIYP